METGTVSTANNWLRSLAMDRSAQEDSRRFIWSGDGHASVTIQSKVPADLSRETNGAMALEIDLRVDDIGVGKANLSAAIAPTSGPAKGINLTAVLSAAKGLGWQTLSVPLSCFAQSGIDMASLTKPFNLESDGKLDLSISRIALGTSAPDWRRAHKG